MDAMRTTNSPGLVSALQALGYRKVTGTHENYSPFSSFYLPCPLGTFANFSSKGKEGCIQCPPGGFYSDDFGYVAESCKKCPNGSFVHFDESPGIRKQDCKSCPEGTETDFFAGKRACKCLEGYYRTHMFEKCHKRGQNGLKCQDDYASLKSGHWWEWRNVTHKDSYKDFIANLLAYSPALDASSIQYPYPIPTPYKCPREDSCKGGLDSKCANGYQGPLCEVCSSGYFKQLQTCKPCPSKSWIVGQLSIFTAVVLVITAVLLWVSKREQKKDGERPLIDAFFSKLKIVIGFYQVTNGLLQAFSFIQWPDSLEAIAKYSEMLQMDVLQIAPIHCLFRKLQVDAFGSMFAMMTVNVSIVGFSVLAYSVRKMIILRNKSLEDEEKLRNISETKEVVYRNLFFFLYVTYLNTCSKTASVLPLACQTLCRDEKEEVCYKYMKADYSIQCEGARYNHLLIGAYVSVAYIFALPAISFIAIWKKQRLPTTDEKKSLDPICSTEMITGLRFLFENYKPVSWYWEFVEMSRKIILTSGLILVGQESRSYIGLAWVIAGMYGMFFAWFKPIKDSTENRLMTISLAVTVVNLGVGAVSRIPAEKIPTSIDPYTDAVLFKMLIFGANTLVIGLVVVQYGMFLYGYLKEWRKNPQWSISCCLALFLPLNDFQAEMSGFVDTNVIQDQLQTGHTELPTILGAVKDSGAIDVTLEEDEQDDDNKVEIQNENCQFVDCSDTRRHKETQTELFAVSFANPVAMEKKRKELFIPSKKTRKCCSLSDGCGDTRNGNG